MECRSRRPSPLTPQPPPLGGTGGGGPLLLIVGLGNPGTQYAGTRHNVGFDAVDRFAAENRAAIDRSRNKALVGEMRERGRRIVLCKPQTYMNLSGEAVGALARFYQVPPANILVVYDELALPLGRLRLLGKGSDGGHNGMKSLIAHLGTSQFPRLRLGVGPKPPQWDQADFVLSRFTKPEQAQAAEMVERAAIAIRTFLEDGLERAMNKVNLPAPDEKPESQRAPG